jgi:hypothetical protein
MDAGPWKDLSTVGLAARAFVYAFASLFGLLIFMMFVFAPVAGLLAGMSPAALWEHAAGRARSIGEGFGYAAAMALAAAALITALVRWGRMLVPQPTEAERARSFSLAVFVAGLASATAGTMSLIVLAADLLHLTLEGPVAGTADVFAGFVSTIAAVAAPLIAAVSQGVGWTLLLDPYWAHGVVVLAGWVGSVVAVGEAFPTERIGRLSWRRSRLLFVLGFGLVLLLLSGRTPVIVSIVVLMPLFQLLVAAVRGLIGSRDRDIVTDELASPWRAVPMFAGQCAMPAAAALAIWLSLAPA